MSNFVFSQSLEISVIEYRLTQLFEVLERINQNHFFPSIIFNETFWQLASEKRISILSHSQLDWVMSNPIHESYCYSDTSILDVIRSVKVSYFSYSKLDFHNFIELLRTKSNFSVSEFSSFGVAQKNPISILNNLFLKKGISPTNPINDFEILAKISAVKFYTRLFKKKSINILIIGSGNDSHYWEFFFKSLRLLDSKQSTEILAHLNVYYAVGSGEIIDNFTKTLDSKPNLKELIDTDKLKFEVIDLVNFSTDLKFDYIHSCYQLCYLPSEILIKSGRDIYNLIGRIVYTDIKDIEAAVKKVSELQSPFISSEAINVEDLKLLELEVSANIYTNKKIIDMVQKNLGFLEGTYVRFSSAILNFLIQSLKALEENGYIEIWDVNENRESIHFQALYRSEGQHISLPVNYELYSNILKSFKDIEIDVEYKNMQRVLSDELLTDQDEFISLGSLISYLVEHPVHWRKVFNIDNFTYREDLKNISKKYNFFQALYKKKILLFRLPTLLYKLGFKKFRAHIIKNPNLNKFIQKDSFILPDANNYNNEFLVALVSTISNLIPEKRFILISNDQKSSQNKEFYEYLENIGFEKESVMKAINELWEELVRYSNPKMNLSLLEIKRK